MLLTNASFSHGPVDGLCRRFSQRLAESGVVEAFEQVAATVNAAAQLTYAANPQVRIIDLFSLTAVRLHSLVEKTFIPTG